jgi:hypothetical protein
MAYGKLGVAGSNPLPGMQFSYYSQRLKGFVFFEKGAFCVI